MGTGARGTVLVTGAAGALGSACIDHYVANGRTVLGLDKSAGAPDTRATMLAVDLADQSALQRALDEAVPRHAPVTLLVNAVGLIWNEPVISLKGAKFVPHGQQNFETVITANLTAAFNAAAVVGARMARSGGGSIINFSSISAQGNVGQVAYSAAKAGIEGMTRAMAAELGPLGVRVNAIAPGFIDVPTTREALGGDLLEDYARRTPVKRLGTLGELLGALDALAENGYLNGHVLPLDGGLRL
ncbi:MAG: SDR family oxidoreductase [Rhizobiaceae bacterium]|nr:SDR family oxidoreductase [Rhizobiaceae bacterium]